jgi:hypothetical protein
VRYGAQIEFHIVISLAAGAAVGKINKYAHSRAGAHTALFLYALFESKKKRRKQIKMRLSAQQQPVQGEECALPSAMPI